MGDLVQLRRAPATIDPGEGPEPSRRPPPMDLDAEAATLAAAALDAEARAHVLQTVLPEHFFSVANARIFDAIRMLVRDGAPVDVVTLASWLRDREWLSSVGGTSYLGQVIDATPHVGNVAAHVAIVLKAYEQRRFIWTAERMAAEVRAGLAGEWESYKAVARAEWGRITAPPNRTTGRTAGAVVADARAHVHAAADGRVVGVRYPWPEVERLVGLLVRGRLTILAGLSEHGKTAAAMQVVCSVANPDVDASGFGEAAYVMTGEMPGPALVLRTACSMAGVDVARVDAGRLEPHEHAEIDRWMRAIEALPIVIDDEPAPAAKVAERIRGWKADFAAGRARNHKGELWPKCRMQLAMGDHATDLADLEQGRDERDRIYRCTKGWADLVAKGCDVAALLLAQLRSLEVRGPAPKFPPWPVEGQLFGAPNAIKRVADTIITVQRPELLMPGKVPAKWIGVAGVSRLKGRFGGDGRRALLGFDRGMFTNDLPPAARGEAHYDDE